ncbi:MAG: YtxH domain-containing protein [Chloroflexi bacterium]|nr:YtxH domain-containing protein [Chloroflexota bacterium]
MTTRNQIVTGIIAGALVGTALGLLVAPKTGRETRQLVATRGVAIKSKAGDYFTIIRNRMKKGDEVESLNGASHQQEVSL